VFPFVLIIPGCSDDDTTPPTITLKGSSTEIVVFKSASVYVDPGYTAEDEIDGDITASVIDSGTVDMNNVGTYYIKYSVNDKAGNNYSVIRTVIVDATPLFVGSFNHTDIIDGVTLPIMIDTLSASSTTKNKIIFKNFSGFTNAAVFATLNGSSVSIPPQTYYCGDFPLDTIRTFATTGTNNTFTVIDSTSSMTLNYTIIQGTDTIICSSIYTKQ
jgi:hypothetical protein